jgi:hypothetical protein
MSVTIDWVWIVIDFIELLQKITTNNYNFSVCCIFTGCHLVTAANTIVSSASMFTSLLAGKCLTTYPLLQLTNSEADGQLTRTSYSSHYHLKTLS